MAKKKKKKTGDWSSRPVSSAHRSTYPSPPQSQQSIDRPAIQKTAKIQTFYNQPINHEHRAVPSDLHTRLEAAPIHISSNQLPHRPQDRFLAVRASRNRNQKATISNPHLPLHHKQSQRNRQKLKEKKKKKRFKIKNHANRSHTPIPLRRSNQRDQAKLGPLR